MPHWNKLFPPKSASCLPAWPSFIRISGNIRRMKTDKQDRKRKVGGERKREREREIFQHKLERTYKRSKAAYKITTDLS